MSAEKQHDQKHGCCSTDTPDRALPTPKQQPTETFKAHEGAKSTSMQDSKNANVVIRVKKGGCCGGR